VSSSHRASRSDRASGAPSSTPRTAGGSHAAARHVAPRDHASARRAIKTATITGGLASMATAVVVGGGVLSAGSPVMDAAGDLAAAANQSSGQSSTTPLTAEQLAARARAPLSRSDRRDSVDRDKATTLAVASGPAVTGSQNLADADPRTIARALLAEFGYGADQFGCLDSLWMSESGWRVNADNPHSSAYGIPQALPGSKMSSEGADWATNPVTQIRWGLGYIQDRYGSPCGAWSFKQGRGWY
jgi:hypothetical protein